MPTPNPERLIAVQLLEAPFEPLEGLAAWQRSHGPTAASPAAESHFIGRVRPTTAAGEPLEALELEHYPGMTEAQLRALAEACAARHGVGAVLVAHRVGRVRPGEAIVLVAVQADRRGPALRCVQELLEDLKHHAPFWKREWSGGRGTWVAGNTPL
ncbi:MULTISPECIES: molybdenum cofactor biosynthesis protein MoaE [unclassified Cyanobium]|uniref:molybdopterin synthase catalytic subunit n=1 Tax=unclassified Cyanobium TaxID=2627006 RepID=UPI0020CC5F5D|nr:MULTISPECIES: molybdenum cofactor biosynthesis protein MoaE [unclassified Cyanobium]MCP9834274.1 molybdenum cofactor biosynthesis protein MoaE [Cyanobium sp. La Preciosa 7G6]MCP9937090.1 molybdenum cofactor biosynthesis protein MoaE [Cyanobium sp. Aljojuca 7A6]